MFIHYPKLFEYSRILTNCLKCEGQNTHKMINKYQKIITKPQKHVKDVHKMLKIPIEIFKMSQKILVFTISLRNVQKRSRSLKILIKFLVFP